jgi:HEPN domain-containing protein
VVNQADLQELAEVRIREARALLRSEWYDGAYYLAGYAVECALKACIAKNTNAGDFPDQKLAQQSNTHDLTKLLGVARLERHLPKQPEQVKINWAIVKDWSVLQRYELGASESRAREYISACTAHKYGVMPWLKTHW